MIEEVVYATLRQDLKNEGYNDSKIELVVSYFPMDYLLAEFWRMYDEQLDGTIDMVHSKETKWKK